VEEWTRRIEGRPEATQTTGAVSDAAKYLKRRLDAIEQELIQTRAKGQLDSIHFPTRLNAKLAALPAVVAASDAAPPRQAYEVFQELSARVDAQLSQLQQVVDTDVASFNTAVRQSDLPAIVPSARTPKT
jgi:hypothetical protein